MTEAQPKINLTKAATWKTAKKVVEKYPGVSINVVKYNDKEEVGYLDMYGIRILFGENMIEEMEAIQKTVDSLPENLSFGNEMGVFPRENVVTTSAKGAAMRGLSKEYKEAIMKGGDNLELMLLIGFVPGQV